MCVSVCVCVCVTEVEERYEGRGGNIQNTAIHRVCTDVFQSLRTDLAAASVFGIPPFFSLPVLLARWLRNSWTSLYSGIQ